MPLAADDETLQVPDDAWEILRDCRAWFLKQAGQLLKEAEPVSEEALAAYGTAIGTYFDERTTSERRTSFDPLDDLERFGHGGDGGAEGKAPWALDSTRIGVPAGAPEAAAIDALAMIFEAIFALPTPPDPIKTALSSL